MSTENEDNEGTAAEAVPSVPSAPPVPADAPQGSPGSPPESAPAPVAEPPATPPHAPHTPPPNPHAPQSAADADWPPPPAVPAYASHGAGAGGPVWGAPPQPYAPEGPRRRGMGGLVAAVAAAALIAGGIGGALGYWAADHNGSGSTTVSASGNPQDLKRDPGTVAGVASKALPSVVTIDAQGGDGEGGTGTGFVYDKEGHILTNNHVVASAADSGQLTATFSNGKKYGAEVVGRAKGYDVAVLKLKNPPSGLAPLSLGNSDQVAVGDSTIAIGAPFGLSNTVTTGIISAKNRPVASGDGSGGSNSYMSALQTDASINPGNSGGPLLDARGAVIGINSAIQSTGSSVGQTQAGSIGLGFAIPINQATNVAQQLIKTGKPVYPVIGATVAMDEKTGGAVISDQGVGGTAAVSKDGPADRAGLKAGDVITKFNDTTIDSGPTLIGEIWTHKPGDRVTLTYTRDGRTGTAEVTLGERNGDS
ncbi:trypsin-like peptidase domain-containing protein [Streptomyces sp. NBC_00264]|uniref:S1C family serine protease n=1 Tax=unclassified Streptomyces TaxID=2593676 RepID=UPI000F5BA497|nr:MULTISPECIES: trypsin-like peptidase domain-containing protein [unclassified Streptomyces]WSG52142.1 trypsin-like peptidase domain-containing protein [Streptomyces sp. NBC_01732]WSX02756.1 trypsin-like peptidase domain-containing protein [Streptomyces sp. NBC_00987]MCX4395332.1 trypsin-like peptidase domain-containing protein [Streptomyces sp. NBC_01767]MCX5102038.1 trypsin-like peptidase domain-containing protein [Streptomyces sp. NBC_00439]MCX5161579.1 trypsin-like peptidase domain-contai